MNVSTLPLSRYDTNLDLRFERYTGMEGRVRLR